MFKIFNIFRSKGQSVDRKKLEEDFHADLLPIFKSVVDNLPNQYSYLKTRFDENLLRGYVKNAINDGSDFYVFLIDEESHKQFETEKNNFLLHNIKIFSNHLNNFVTLQLHIHNNLPVGFEFSDQQWDFDKTRIDTSQVKVLHYENAEYQKWTKIIGQIPTDLLNQFDTINGFEIDIERNKYFTIKEFGNGDYVAINEKRQIFGLIHENKKLEKIFDNPELMYSSLRNKSLALQNIMQIPPKKPTAMYSRFSN